MTPLKRSQPSRLSWTIAGITAVFIFAAFTAWSEVPTDERAIVFWPQIAMFFLVLCAFAGLGWHLFLRPLPARAKQPSMDELPRNFQQKLAILMSCGAMSVTIGAFWDELWHRQYGIPFGEDFFWRPHLLMYFGFATTVVVGFWALRYLNRNLKGSFQQRFRSNPLVGLLILNGAFMLYSLPADPIWHMTYGEDITAWSIPHLILLVSLVMTLLLSVILYTTTVSASPWRSVLQPRGSDFLPLLVIAATLLTWIQLILIDWDSLLSEATSFQIAPWLYRPEWLMLANMVAIALVTGVIATRLLRCAGAATLAGLIALAIRYVLIQFVETDLMHYESWLIALVPLLAIDLWTYYVSVVRKEEPEWRGTAFAVAASMALALILARQIFVQPPSHIAAIALAVVLTGIGASWFAHQIAGWVQSRLPAESSAAAFSAQSAGLSPRWSAATMMGFALFSFTFLLSAPPPV